MAATADITTRFMDAYDELSDAIFRHCYFRVYDREKARDLAQEAFARTWEYLAAGKEVDNLKAFIYRVAGNLVIDASRRARPLSLDALMEDGFIPAAETTAGEVTDAPTSADAALMLDRLAVLDEPYRSAVTMRYLEGLAPGEIAAITGETENVISVRIHRGVKKLRDTLV